MKTKTRRMLAASLLAVYLFSNTSSVFAEEEMNKVMKLTLDYATASAEKKDAAEGGKEVLKKQFDDWTWNYVVGNYEKLIFQNADAEIPGFKEKLNKISELLDRIGTISTQLGEGKYDEAAFTAIDQAVSTVDHPAVSAVWAAVKMAYESHQLVKQTGAELNIEALYGALDNDRRLRGTSSGNGPKLFNMDSQTVDYFFNKYLITGDGTREMMKSYVKVRLGEEFPEASTMSKFSGWIFGTDSAKEDELAELEKFKNVSRRWIGTLLKDLNTQATASYNETRIRQELAAFEKFAAGFKYLNLSAEEILKEYKDLKAYKEDAKNFPKYLSDSQKIRTFNEQQYEKISKNSYKSLNSILEIVYPIISTVNNAKIKAHVLKMTDFEDSFSRELGLWSALTQKISSDMSNITSSEAKTEAAAVLGASGVSQAQSYFNSYFGNLISEYAWANDFDYKNKEILDALNSADFTKATELSEKFKIQESEGLTLHNGGKNREAEQIFLKNMGSLQSQYAALLKVETINKAPLWAQMEQVSRAMEALGMANKMYYEASYTLYASQRHKLDEIKGLIDGEIAEYKALKDARTIELANYRAALKKIYPNLPIRTVWMDGTPLYTLKNEPSLEYQYTQESYKYFNENRYVSFGKSSSTSPRSYPGELAAKAQEIEQMANNLRLLAESVINDVPLVIKRWEIGLKDWNALKKPEPDEIEQYIVLVDRNFVYENEFGICDIGAARVSGLAGQLNSMKSALQTAYVTEDHNRMTDVDFIKTKVKQYNDYLNRLVNQGVVTYDTPVTGVPIAKSRNFSGEFRVNLNADPATGMLVINTPVPHIATQKELKTIPELAKTKAEFKAQPFYSFVAGNAPQITNYFNKLFDGEFTPYAKEENLLFGTPKEENIVWLSQLTAAELLVNNISVEDKDSYYKSMKALSDAIPKVVRIVSPSDLKAQTEAEQDPIKKHYLGSSKPDELGTMIVMDESNLASSPMGKRFLDLREKTKKLIDKRKAYIQKKLQDESDAYYKKEVLDYFTKEINKFIKEVSNPPANYDENFVNDLYTRFSTLRGSYIDRNINDSGLNNVFSSTETSILAMNNKLKQQDVQDIQGIKDLYNSFKQAYEAQNSSLVMSKISNNWECGDGTTVSDLESNFNNMFSVFNVINYNLSNLSIQKRTDNTYNVSYDVEIIGQIYGNDISHKEKSSVNEIVAKEGNSFKILKTLNGRFWYIE